jgi:hypothetical protein
MPTYTVNGITYRWEKGVSWDDPIYPDWCIVIEEEW